MAKSINLYNKPDKSLLVDDDVYDKILPSNVYFYFIRSSPTFRVLLRDSRKLVNINKVIFDFNHNKYYVHHKNGDYFDKTKDNLLLRERSLIARESNTSLYRGNPYKGVSFCSKYQKFKSYICYNSKTIVLGLYSSPKEAALVYDAAAFYLFGETVYLNFKEEVGRVLPCLAQQKLEKEMI